MNCAELREQLEDIALGATTTPELRSHLAECATCAAELERQRALVRRLDDAIHAVVRAEPPPNLLAGVAARLTYVRWYPWSAVRPRMAVWAAAAACAVVLALGFRALERPPAPRSDVSALAAWRSPTISLLEPRGVSIDSRPSPRRVPGGTRGS